jgi:hypothetical protein
MNARSTFELPNDFHFIRYKSMRNRIAIAAILGFVLSANGAEAGVRNFFAPAMDGARLDACLSGGNCGKTAADAFCKVQGYDKSVLFQRERFESTRVLDSGSLCTGDSCTAFKQIKCFTAKSDFAGSHSASYR